MPCPICDKPTNKDYRPFCSGRCADIDLGKWFGGSYAIPATDPDEMEELENQQRDATEGKPH